MDSRPRAAPLLVLALASCITASAQAAAGARVVIHATVLPYTRVNMQVPATVNVSHADARDGVVRLDNAAAISVTCNQSSYALQFEVTDPQVIDVEVIGLGVPVRVGPEGKRVQIAAPAGRMRPSFHALGYRIRYAAGVGAGERPMPLRVSVENG